MLSPEEQARYEAVVRADGRYPLEAYEFLHEGLVRAVAEVHGEKEPPTHVTGQQLCHALRELALERWGMLARAVLERWNIRGTIDFGNMVYLLIGHKYMAKTDTDSLDDFDNVFDLAKELDPGDPFEIRE